MYTLHLAKVVLLMLFHAVLSFGEYSPKAVILHNCTTSASCSYTYEQVYHSLAKSENSFNISSALYPGRSRPSSVRVFVNVYGPNKTKESIPAKYTWSMSCFYSAVPAFALEVLSLGSILVKRRTQDLNLQIPLFCCNISDNEEQRKQQIGSLLIRVLAELQDLADSPGIRNPNLNTARCVIQGHKLNLSATERASFIRTVLWCSLGFVVLSSMLLVRFILEVQRKAWPDTNDQERHSEKEKSMAKAICISAFFLFLLGSGTLGYVLVKSSIYFANREASFDIPVILGLVFLYSFIFYGIWKKIFPKSYVRCYSWIFFICVNATSYHFCWIMIGMMIHPVWALTVALVICCFFASLTFATYLYLYKAKPSAGSCIDIQCLVSCTSGFLAVLPLIVIVVFAGQSYNGKETADDVLKTILLYFIGAFVSFISLKTPHIILEKKIPFDTAASVEITSARAGNSSAQSRIQVKIKRQQKPTTIHWL